MTAVAAFESLTMRYGRILALDEVSLALRPGESVALVGHNGAGKTTFMKLVLGLIRPSDGTVRVRGEDPAGRHGAAIRRDIGFLPESVAFHNAMTGAELLAFYARLKDRAPEETGALLAQVGLAEAAGRRVATYSKGMRQRLGLAQALLGEPKLLLLDEPTSGLDPDSRAQVYGIIDSLRRRGATVLVSTHALAEIERHVERVALLDRGRLIAAGPLAELRAAAALPLTVRLAVETCSTAMVLERIGRLGEVVGRQADSLVLAVDPADKLALIEALGRLGPCLKDIEIETPGLDRLYRHLVSRHAGGRAEDRKETAP